MPDVRDTQPTRPEFERSRPPAQTPSVNSDPRDGNDALCFTPGFPGATFGAGAIHAYLAADRKHPQVVAGISLGTVSATVMQRSYADLENARTAHLDEKAIEAARWKFFRKYLSTITERPFQVVWNGIPDPADFFGDLPPIKDPVPETITDEDLRKQWKKQEREARRELYLLVKLGHWLGNLPIRMSTIANVLVSHVRSKEKYSSPKSFRVVVAKLWQLATVISLILHVIRTPARFPDYKFAQWREEAPDSIWRFHAHTSMAWLRAGWAGGWTKFLYGLLNIFTGLYGAAVVIWAIVQYRGHSTWAGQFPYFLITLFSLGSLHIILLALIAKQAEHSEQKPKGSTLPSWWFHLRSAAAWVVQRPLFGWPLYFSSLAIIAILQLYTAMLSVSCLGYVNHSWQHVIWAFPASLLGLFCTTSLATWWIPMRGKFPFRAIPLLCTVVLVTLITLSVQTNGFATRLFSAATTEVVQQSATPTQASTAQSRSSLDAEGGIRNSIEEIWNGWHESRLIANFRGFLGHSGIASIVIVVLGLMITALALAIEVRDDFIKSLLQRVEMQKHMVHDYHLKFALTNLFGENGASPPLSHLPFPLVLVAAPLQSVGAHTWENNQLWARASYKPTVPEASPAEVSSNETMNAPGNPPAQNSAPRSDAGKGSPATQNETRLVDVLRATLATPIIFDPHLATGTNLGVWYKPKAADRTNKDGGPKAQGQPKPDHTPSRLDLVDGSVIRQNPLPAFFNFIRRNPEMVAGLESTSAQDARVHVVYNVPTQATTSEEERGDGNPTSPRDGTAKQGMVEKPAAAQAAAASASASSSSSSSPQADRDGKLNDIVDVALLSLRLAQRRDIYLEIEQTNFIARLAHETRKLLETLPEGHPLCKKAKSAEPIFPIFADDISPVSDLSFENLIAPKRDEVLRHAAAGCKATLQRLYSVQIANTRGPVDCKEFLNLLRKTKGQNCGLPEICKHCDGCLSTSTDAGEKRLSERKELTEWEENTNFSKDFPQLAAGEPRIVFVASGGVFRGPFHVGMINAMLALNIRPDLVVGASVGTLVGGALAATLAAKNRQDSLAVLGQLVNTFQNVDERIAFTKSLKNATRELGLRGRMIDLSPVELRHKISQGTQSDPAFAVTGTPPVLIDAISELLLIPHQQTSRIAAEFVAGHFAEAISLLVQALKRETLTRLGIDRAVMGASLLEPAARLLLGAMLKDQQERNSWYDLKCRQPYQKDKKKIAMFATATDLCGQRSVLLGAYKYELPSYDFVSAALASSAFPAVFSPRRESEIFPGLGRADSIYSDGGMFDNLPISPAVEILAASQKDYAATDPVGTLGKRLSCPDLFITGSLDVNDDERKEAPRNGEQNAGELTTRTDGKEDFDNLRSIKRRTTSLQQNLKIRAFEEVSEQVSAHLDLLYELAKERQAQGNLPSHLNKYLKGLVNAVLLPVYPADEGHLNGTFQFCNSLGRDPEVVNKSMADGCFQTLLELARSLDGRNTKPSRFKAVSSLVHKERIPDLRLLHHPPVANKDSRGQGRPCGFFSLRQNGGAISFTCPFSEGAESQELYEVCTRDSKHRRTYQDELVKITAPPKVSPPEKTLATSASSGSA